MRNDLTIYSKFASQWWQKDGYYFRSLQNITPFRLSLIAELLGELRYKSVLDLGCGGGLISVPLLQQGANVTGIDMSPESISVARTAAGQKGTFIVGDVRALDINSNSIDVNSIDVVLILDVLDHIPQYSQVLGEASRVLRYGGKLFIGTLNRTILSHFFTIILGETLGYIPRGTHDSGLFIKPNELVQSAAKHELQHIRTIGEWPCIFKTLLQGAIALRKSTCTAIAYSAVFEKKKNAQ